MILFITNESCVIDWVPKEYNSLPGINGSVTRERLKNDGNSDTIAGCLHPLSKPGNFYIVLTLQCNALNQVYSCIQHPTQLQMSILLRVLECCIREHSMIASYFDLKIWFYSEETLTETDRQADTDTYLRQTDRDGEIERQTERGTKRLNLN